MPKSMMMIWWKASADSKNENTLAIWICYRHGVRVDRVKQDKRHIFEERGIAPYVIACVHFIFILLSKHVLSQIVVGT